LILLVSVTVIAQDEDMVLQGKPVSEWIKQLRSENRGLQLRAAQVLSSAPTNLYERIIPQVIPVLRSERENDRFVAAQVLGSYGPGAKNAVPDLLPLLEGTQYERNRAAGAKALGQILKDAQPSEEIDKVVQALIKLFRDKYSDVRREAVVACGMIGPAAKLCIPHLPELFSDGENPWGENALVRRSAAWACGRMGSLGAEHIDRLINMMFTHPFPEVVEAIGEIGPVNENVVKNVMRRMEQVMNVHDLLLGEPKAKDYLPTCFAVLEKFGPKASPAVPLMKRLLKEQPREYGGPHIPVLALKVLGAIGPDAKDAIPEIEKLLSVSKDPAVKKAGEEALQKITSR
jgi:hypothetical protein